MIPSDASQLERLLNEKLETFVGVGKKLVTVTTPAPGQVEISASVSDLEFALEQLAKREASKHGVSVEQIRLHFHEIGPRVLELDAKVRAKKMFFTTTLLITGRLAIDEQLTATISDLRCTGDGAIGSIASGVLAPQLAKLNGRAFPLAELDLGERTLRDVRLRAGENLVVTAEFAA